MHRSSADHDRGSKLEHIWSTIRCTVWRTRWCPTESRRCLFGAQKGVSEVPRLPRGRCHGRSAGYDSMILGSEGTSSTGRWTLARLLGLPIPTVGLISVCHRNRTCGVIVEPFYWVCGQESASRIQPPAVDASSHQTARSRRGGANHVVGAPKGVGSGTMNTALDHWSHVYLSH